MLRTKHRRPADRQAKRHTRAHPTYRTGELGLSWRKTALEALEERRLLAVTPVTPFNSIASVLSADLDAAQSQLKSQLDSFQTGSNSNIPFLGNKLGDASQFISHFGTQLHDALAALGSLAYTSDDALDAAVKNTIGPALGSSGLGILADQNGNVSTSASADTDDVLVTNPGNLGAGGFEAVVRLHFEPASANYTGNFTAGLPSLPLQMSNVGVTVTTGFDLELAFGYNANSGAPFFDSSRTLTSGPGQGHELAVTVAASLPSNFSAQATVGFIHGALTPIAGMQTGLTASVVADHLDTTPTAAFTFHAGVNLRLDGGFSAIAGIDGSNFPSITADFHLNWSFDSSNPAAGAPSVSFDNVGLDLGSFLSNIVGPVISDIQSVTDSTPVKQIIDVLTARLPVISDLGHLIGDDPISIIDLAKLVAPFTGFGPLIDVVADLITLANDVNMIQVNSDVVIPLGGFDLSGYDLRTVGSAGDASNLSLPNLTSLDPDNIRQAIQNFTGYVNGPDVPQGVKDALNQFTSGLNNGIDFEFPILDNPGQAVFGMLLGRDSDLFSITATLNLDAEGLLGEVAPFGVDAGFSGDIKIDGKLKFGYDTYGLREMIGQAAAGTLRLSDVASDLTDGFYISDDSNLTISGKVGVVAGVSVLVFSAAIEGGVTTGDDGHTPISITVDDPSSDGRLRLNELASHPFKASGELDAGLTFEVKFGVSILGHFVGYEKDFDIAHTVIVSFPPQTPPAVTLASQPDASGNVTLYIGSRAGERQGVDQTDGGEKYAIRHVGDDGDGETIEIDAFDKSQTIHHVKSITGLGDQGDLTINVMPGVTSDVILHGGQGHANLTYSGTGQAILTAGQFDSALTGGVGSNFLYGGPGNDTLTTGPGHNTIGDAQGDNTVIVAGPFTSLSFSGGSPGHDTLEVVAQKTTIAISVTPGSGFVQLQIDDSSAPESTAILTYFSQLIVNAHGSSTNVTVGDLSDLGITSETVDVTGGGGHRAIDLETRANGGTSYLTLNPVTETYPDAKDPTVQIAERGVAVVNGTAGLTTNVFGMNSVDTLIIHQHGGITTINDLGTAAGTIILSTASRHVGSLGETVTVTTPAWGAGSTVTTDGYGFLGSGGFRIRATGDPDIVVANLQTSDNVYLKVSAADPGYTNQVALDASALAGALHVTALGAFYDTNNIQLTEVGYQAAVYIDGADSAARVDVGVGDLRPVEGQVTVSNAVLTVDNSQRGASSILTMTGTQLSGWDNPLIGPATLYFGGLNGILTVNLAPVDQLDLEQTPAGITGATFNDVSGVRDYGYLVGASAPLTFNGDFSLVAGEHLLPDGNVRQANDLTGLAGISATFNLSGAAGVSSFVHYLNPAAQAYSLAGNGNLVVTNQTVGFGLTINGYGSQDSLTLDLPGGMVSADITRTSLGMIYVDGSSREPGPSPANNVTVTSNAANITMLPDATVPQTYRITPSNEPVFIMVGMSLLDVLTVSLLAPQPNQVYIDASALTGSLNVNALGDATNQDDITLAKAGPQAAVTIDGGATSTEVTFATGRLGLIEHDVTVRNAHLTVDDSASAIANIVALTDTALTGWRVPNTTLTPVLYINSLATRYSGSVPMDQPEGGTVLTVEAGAGDRFDIESKLLWTINNSTTTRDAVYSMAGGKGTNHLNGDFALYMGWRLLEDGTIFKPETLGSLATTIIVNFTTVADTATQIVFDGNLDPPGAAYTMGNDAGIPNLVVTNQTVGLNVDINGYRAQDQVNIDLPGGVVNADLRHTGPATICLDGTARLAGTNPTAANEYTLQARAGQLTMQPDGADNSVFQMFNTLYLLGSLPQDTLALNQTTNFKVAPIAALPPSPYLVVQEISEPFVVGGETLLPGNPGPGFVYYLHSPAQSAPVASGDTFSYAPPGDFIYNVGYSFAGQSPANTILDYAYGDDAVGDYLADNVVGYADEPLTYSGVLGSVSFPIRLFTASSHPVPIDNTVTLDASQLRGSFNYHAVDPDYPRLLRLLDPNLFAYSGGETLAFGETSVSLSGANPELTVNITGQQPLHKTAYSVPNTNSDEHIFDYLVDKRIPATSVNIGSGVLANLQGNVTVHLAQLTVDDSGGTLPNILTLTDTGLTGWATTSGLTQPTLFFDGSLHDDLVITGGAADRFDVENTPYLGSAVLSTDYDYVPVTSQTVIQNLATSGPPSAVCVMGKGLQPLHVIGDLALTIGERLRGDGSVDKVGVTDQVFYTPPPSRQITFDYLGTGLGPLTVDRSNESAGDYDSSRFVTAILANADTGYGYLQTYYGHINNFLTGSNLLYGPNTELFYLAPASGDPLANPFVIDNTSAATVHYIVNPRSDPTSIQIGAAFGPVDVQGNGANTRVFIDPEYYYVNGVAAVNLRDTIFADVSVNNATLRIVADAAGAPPPEAPAKVVLSDAEVTGVADSAIRFQNLVSDASGFGLVVQLPRGIAVSTRVESVPTAHVEFLGGASGDTLVGPGGDTAWQIGDANSGTLNGSISFKAIANLQGGDWADTFSFLPGGSLSGNLDGGSGWDTLDYTAAGLAGSEPLDLTHGIAPHIAGVTSNIERVLLAPSSLTAENDVYSASNAGGINVSTAAGVLANDSDTTGGTPAAELDRGPNHGTLTLNADGSFTYVPAVEFVGDDSFGYHVNDGSLFSGEATVTIRVYAPPQVVAIAVNGDAAQAQRSQILSLQVTFNETVNLGSAPAGAFQLLGPDGRLVNLSAAVSTNASGATVATLTFLPGPDTYRLANGQYALADGRYRLTVLKNTVEDGNQRVMDADVVDSFFRLFGDVNGDAKIDLSDLTAARDELGRQIGDGRYLWYLDDNGDGRIDNVDYIAVRTNYGRKL